MNSEIGKGTLFRIYLPQVEGKIIAEEAGLTIRESLKGGETILLVEDEEIVRNFIHEVLREEDYNVLLAQNGEEALKLVQLNKAPVHLLLSDVVMPGMGGVELAKRLMPQFSELKVLFMSGYTENAPILSDNSENNRCGFLQKPVSTDILLGEIRELLGKQ